MSFVYRGLEATYSRHMVADEEVDRQIQTIRQQNPRIAQVKDRPAQIGDEVVLDYAGFVNGVQFAGGTAERQTLVLGSGQFIPGFEEQLVDKVPEEPVVVKVTFPEQYHAEDLAGKEAEFRCTIHEIHIKTEYQLDDVFAQEVGGCYTFEEFRETLKKAMQQYSDERGEMDLQDQLLRKAAATLEVTFAEEDVKKAVDEQLDAMRAQLAQQGLSLEMYCQFMGKKEEDLREDYRAAAENELRIRAAVAEIVRLEAMEATEKDMEEAKEAICRINNITMEQLKEHYDAEFEAAVKRTVLTSKVAALIREAAVIS